MKQETDSHKPLWEALPRLDQNAVMAEVIMLKRYGVLVDREWVSFFSKSNGYYFVRKGGTALADVGKMMEIFGVSVRRDLAGSRAELEKALRGGYGVIVSVRAESRQPNKESELLKMFRRKYGKAAAVEPLVVVLGYGDMKEAAPKVVVYDPGRENATGEVCLLEDFLELWGGEECYMVVTEQPLPHVEHNESGMMEDYTIMYKQPAGKNYMPSPMRSEFRGYYEVGVRRSEDFIETIFLGDSVIDLI